MIPITVALPNELLATWSFSCHARSVQKIEEPERRITEQASCVWTHLQSPEWLRIVGGRGAEIVDLRPSPRVIFHVAGRENAIQQPLRLAERRRMEVIVPRDFDRLETVPDTSGG